MKKSQKFIIDFLSLLFIISCSKQNSNGEKMNKVEIIGIYPIEADEPVHLIEIIIKESEGVFDIGEFTQEILNEPQANWQVPYMEYILDSEGDKILADDFEANSKPELWIGNMRIVFFFHYLDFTKPLKSPFGNIILPKETKLPQRLKIIHYDSPD